MTRGRIRRLATLAVLGVAVSVIMTGCGVSVDDSPHDIVVAARDDNAAVNPQTAITATNTSVIYLVDGSSPVSAARLLTPVARDVAETIDNAMAALFAGPTIREGNADLLTAIPPTVRLFGAVPNGDVVTVDISDPMSALTASQRIAAIGQIVLTATGVAGVSGVVITVAGAEQAWPKANGTTTTDPLTHDDFVALVPSGNGTTPSIPSTSAVTNRSG